MSVNLHQAFENNDFWTEVKQSADEMLRQAGHGKWQVYIEPATPEMRQQADSSGDPYGFLYFFREATKEMRIGVPAEFVDADGDQPAHFAEMAIIEPIDLLAEHAEHA